MRTCNPDFETLQQSRCNTLLLMRLCFCCLPGETLHVFCCPFSSPHHHHLQYLSPHAVVFLLPSTGDLARFVLPLFIPTPPPPPAIPLSSCGCVSVAFHGRPCTFCAAPFHPHTTTTCNTSLLMRLCFCCLPGETLHVLCCPPLIFTPPAPAPPVPPPAPLHQHQQQHQELQKLQELQERPSFQLKQLS